MKATLKYIATGLAIILTMFGMVVLFLLGVIYVPLILLASIVLASSYGIGRLCHSDEIFGYLFKWGREK